MTIREWLDAALIESPDQVYQQFKRNGDWHQRTFRAFGERVRQVAEGVNTLGIGTADKVALWMENSPEWVEIYCALAGCGITVVPIDPKLKPDEATFILHDSEVVAVFASSTLTQTLCKLLPDIHAITRVVLVGDSTSLPPGDTFTAYAALLTEAAAVASGPDACWLRQRPQASTAASLIYTSGTTGKPKGAILTHENFTADADNSLRLMEIRSDDNFFLVLPLFHSFSFLANLIVPLRRQCSVTFADSLRTIADDMRATAPSVLCAVPLLVEKLHGRVFGKLRSNSVARLLLKLKLGRLLHAKVNAAFGGKLRLIISGGAPCSVAVLLDFRAIGFGVVEGYGLTETSPVVSLTDIGDFQPGTVGKPIPNIEVRIADPDAQGVGELLVRGPIVMQGYFKNSAATAEAISPEGWLYTGDLAALGHNGHLSIHGRKKALIINREGKNIYPEEVEQVIARSPLVHDVIVLGYHEADDVGERVGVIMVPDRDAVTAAYNGVEPEWAETVTLLKQTMAKQCASLAAYKHPRKTEVWPDPLERSSTQKVRRHLYQGRLDSPRP